MKRLPLLLLFTLIQLLPGTVEALSAAGGAETVFFYQAYLLELQHVTNPERRAIARKCPIPEGRVGCSFAEFVKFISSNKARGKNQENWSQLVKIFDDAEDTSLRETSRKLREAHFFAEYDQETFFEKDPEAHSLSVAIRKARAIVTTTKKPKYPDHKRKMIEALELESELRQADNMKFFIPKLEGELGITLERKLATTSDGLKYETYDIQATAEKNEGVQDLAKKLEEAANKLRKMTRKNGDDMEFAIHQAVIREVQESLAKLKEKCP
ncbi:Protein of unknown function DUF4246 [Penicillium coprophilum]|uniref:Protein of unknown function DUF4246 n=1 Tax=Penicillium coprophilum TaxID=36646 RepID=UPI0023A43628|nr:Protein of unknown function DUF4246 [Penicillium coprophilum]KAJ5165677.1 Protein of unknown function DUF4246 [Penicillium coprophilum]